MPETVKRGRRKRRQTKDRVLQARIPEQLDEEIRDRAEHLGLSVSTVVRNVLLHTFDLVEGVVSDSAQIARALQGRETATPMQNTPGSADIVEPEGVSTVVGWQEATLNKNGICEECNAILPRGARAAIGVPAPAHAVLLCLDCLATLSSQVDETPPQAPKPADPKNAIS
jgi:hypothetical protein